MIPPEARLFIATLLLLVVVTTTAFQPLPYYAFRRFELTRLQIALRPTTTSSPRDLNAAEPTRPRYVEETVNQVQPAEIYSALATARKIISQSGEELHQDGWKQVHKEETFSLHKHRRDGPVTYLMIGHLPDVSPRSFFHAQIDTNCRRRWDALMKDLQPIFIKGDIEKGGETSQDNVYFRTKWPWPMKDRDYVLSRRYAALQLIARYINFQ